MSTQVLLRYGLLNELLGLNEPKLPWRGRMTFIPKVQHRGVRADHTSSEGTLNPKRE